MGCCDDKKKCCGISYKSIPAAMGDDTGGYKPENGAYYNTLIRYEANGALYFYTNDGVWTQLDGERFFEMIKEYEREANAMIDQRFDDLDVQEEINNKLDQMAEDGELGRIIAYYFDDKMKVIFPTYGIDGEDTLGDCTIFKIADKSLMIDCFADDSDTYSSITSTLLAEGISKLDYMLITHYHGDHMGNIFKLINDGYLDNAVVILPRAVTRWEGSDYTGNAIKSALEANNIEWVECSNQTITINDAEFELFNGSEADYSYYNALDSDSVEYNDYSICANVLYHDRKILMTGDAARTACRYITPRYLYSDYDLIKDNHHGFIEFTSEYAKKVNPDYVLISASDGMINKNLSRWASLSSYWQQCCDSKVYIQGLQSEPTVFSIGYNGVDVTSESYSVEGFGGRGSLQYYVDGTTSNTLRTGSLDYPFKTLAEANALMAKNMKSCTISLTVINTPSDVYPVYFSGYSSLSINFDNKLTNTDIEFYNCGQIKLTNCNTSGLIRAKNVKEITIDGLTSTVSSYSSIELYDCRATITGALVTSGFTNQMIRVDNSTLNFKISSLTTTLNSRRIFAGTNNTILYGADAITALSSYKFYTEIMTVDMLKTCNISENGFELQKIFQSDPATGVTSGIVCNENVWRFPYVVVVYVDGSNNNHVEKYPTSGVWNFFTSFLSSDGNTLYVDSASATFTDKTVTLSRNRELTLSTSGVTLGTQNTIKIKKIYGSI